MPASRESLGELFVEIKADVADIKAELNKIERGAKRTGETVENKMGAAFKRVGGLLVGLGLGRMVLGWAKSAIRAAADFQTLRTRLNALYGDARKGGVAFSEFVKVAATTPFAVKDVVEAGAALKAFGANATGTIKPVADLAAFMGTDIVTAAQAFGRAFAGGAGAADVLRERGVLQLIKSFKGIDDLTKLTLPQFRQALTESISDPAAGIAGATNELAKTFDGAVSNMFDAIQRFGAEMGGKFLPQLTRGAKAVGELFSAFTTDPLRDEQAELNATIRLIQSYAVGTEERISKIKELQSVYPNLLANLDAETVSNKELSAALKGANAEFEKRAKLAALEAELADAQSDLAIAYREQFAAIKGIQTQLAAYIGAEAAGNLELEEQVKLLQQLGQEEGGIGTVGKLTNGILRLTGVIPNATGAVRDYISAQKSLDEARAESLSLFENGIAQEIAQTKESIGVLTEKANIEKTITEQRKEPLPPRPERPEIGLTEEDAAAIMEDLETEFTKEVKIVKSFGEEMGDAFTEGISGSFVNLFTPLTDNMSKEASAIERTFAQLIDTMIQKALQLAILNLLPGGFLGGLFQHGGTAQFRHGGVFMPNAGTIKKAQAGASFEVPPGFANDRFPLMVETGERVDVTSRGQTSAQGFQLSQINDSVQALNQNLVDSVSRRNGNGPPQEVVISGEITNDGIYLSNQKGDRRYNRFR